MDGKLRHRLETELEAMSPRERAALSQRAQQKRREAQRRQREAGGKRGGRRGPRVDAPLHEWILEVMAEGIEATDTARSKPEREGIVVALSRRHATVRSDGDDLECTLANELARAQRNAIAVGDDVTIGLRDDARYEVNGVARRRTVLSRPDPHDPQQERVVAANVDLVLVVVTPRDPPLRTGLIDRYLVAVARGGARPVVVLNKADLDPDPAGTDAVLAPYAELGVPVRRCSAHSGEGIEALRALMRGHLCAFVGHSGVGKSSLTNALAPELDLEVGEVNEVVRKGRHTTTRSTLHELSDGVRLIDTPGVRAFGIWRVDPLDLRWYFADLAEHAAACRYADCLHDPEDECGVKAAVARGELAAARYESYLRILGSLRGEG